MATTQRVDSPDGPVPVLEVAPDGVARGGVVVVQEAFGVNDHIEDVAGRFAAAGYRAVAPHLYHRSGDPIIAYDDLAAVGPPMQQVTEAGLLNDLDAAIGVLTAAGVDPSRIGVVGFCMGGSVTVLAAARRSLGAAVTFYGGGVVQGRFGMPPLLELVTELVTPWLGLYGGQDGSIPVDQIVALEAAAGRAAVDTEVVRYADAGHGFHCDARPGSYHQPSAADGWRRTLDWFDRHLAG